MTTTPEYLLPLLNPFPISTELLDEIQSLCEYSKEISSEVKVTNDFRLNSLSSSYAKCKQLYESILEKEEAFRIYKRSNRSQSSVTIGSRGNPNSLNQTANTPVNEETYQSLSDDIKNFITGTPNYTLRKNANTKSFPLRNTRQRSQTTSEITPLKGTFGKIQLEAIKTREDKRSKHLSVTLDQLVDESPQEKLLHVFAKHKRASCRVNNAWKEYMNSVASENPNTSTSRARKSIRYGTRKSMNTFLKKRKSRAGDTFANTLKLPMLQNEELQIFNHATIPKSPQPQIFAPRNHPVNNNNKMNENKKVNKLGSSLPSSPPPKQKEKFTAPPLVRKNSSLDKLVDSTTNKRRLTVNCQEEDETIRFKKMISSEDLNSPSSSVPSNEPLSPKIVLRQQSKRFRTNSPTSVPKDMREDKDNESWRNELRMAWESEITTMSSSKQEWYKQVEKPKTPIRNRSKKLLDAKEYRTKEKALKALTKYKITLEKEFLSCGMSIRSLRLKEKAHRNTAKEELIKYKSYYNPILCESYRKYVVANLLYLKSQIHYEDKKSLIINQTLRKTKQGITLIQGLPPNKPIPAGSARNYSSVESLCSTDTMIKLREIIKKRQKLFKKIQREHQNLSKGQGTFITQESRQQRLLRIIYQLKPHNIINTFHEFNDNTQNIIDTILLDQRCRSGMKILRLWEAIKATGIDEIPPHEIVDFLQDFVDETAVEFAVPDDYLDRLRLCVGRAVFPVLFSFLWDFRKIENQLSDAKFEDQQIWLRTIPPEKLDSVLEPFSHHSNLFDDGISILEELQVHIIPADMLMVLYRTMEHIHKMASSSIGGDLGADDLFPIWLYLTIHANIPCLHSHLCYMEHFATPEESMTQLGYCLTTFQACVAHVSTVDKSKFN